jgi:acetoin utilization deacetylase AcuC-like enzyme
MEMCFKEKTFSLMRPPGHHSSSNTMEGFCYFNNLAIAVTKALKSNMAKRVAILDIDVHHGNGTQSIFFGNPQVLYVSLHELGIYPGTGTKSEKNCINCQLSPGANERDYLIMLREAVEKIKAFGPHMIAVSAGFDTYRKDPLANINLDIETYRKIGTIIADMGIPTFSVLEGGYSEKLPECIYQYLIGVG